MQKTARKFGTFLTVLFMLAFSVLTVVSANAGPRKRPGGTQSVPEPATIVLLGVGLASVGAYAIRKRKKK